VPIWSPEARVLISADAGPRLGESLADHLDLTRRFFAGQLPRLALQLAVFFIVLVLARLARARAQRLDDKGASEAAATPVLRTPMSAALAALVSTIWIYFYSPRVVMNAVGVAILLPALTRGGWPHRQCVPWSTRWRHSS
jgi:hypothetical protein